MSNHFEEITIEAPSLGVMNFYNSTTGMLCIIKEDRSYTLCGNNPDSVTDEELWDMADGFAPDNWETVQRATPGSIQHNLVRAYGGAAG